MKLLCLIISLFLTISSFSQEFYFHDSSSSIQFIKKGDTLKTGFFGGFNSPRMSACDLNADGITDLFVFDPVDQKVLTFIGNGLGVNPPYLYAPQYEVFFPTMSNWALLVDMNCDGLEDILCGNGENGLAIYLRKSKDLSRGFNKKIDELNYYDLSYKYDLKFVIEPDDVPIIDDIDNDGDVDFLTFHENGSKILYCQNQRVERNLDCNEFDFEIETNCWGMFQEGGEDASLSFLSRCYLDDWAFGLHSGSNALAIDIDDDGDKDILLSDIDTKGVLLLENGRVQMGNSGARIDSIINWQSGFPKYDKSIDIDLFPSMFSLDLDFDSVKDLYVASGIELSNFDQNSWYYHNAGSNTKPKYQLQTKSFLKNIDFGRKSYPVFLDEDGDGDQDILLATEEENGSYYVLHLLKNVGSISKPLFSLVDNNYINLRQYKIEDHCALSIGDIDNNGTLDLVVGAVHGQLLHFSNQNKVNEKVHFVFNANYLKGIKTCEKPSPFIYDMDNDGQNDLLIGTDSGTVEYWQSNSGNFTLKNERLGNIWVGDVVGGTVYDGHANIHIANVDSNNKPDLLIAADNGYLRIYFDFDLKDKKWKSRKGNFYNRHLWADTSAKFLGSGIRIAATDLNADGFLDILVAGKRGGIQFYNGIVPIKINVVKPKWQQEVSIWPNPNSGFFYLRVPELNTELSITIYNSTGQLVKPETYLITKESQYDLTGLPNGVYLICLKDAQGFFSQKLIIK